MFVNATCQLDILDTRKGNIMDMTQAISIIIGGMIVPIITALFTRPNMDSATKRMIVIGVSVFVGVVMAIGTGAIQGVPAEITLWIERVIVAVSTVVALSQGYYQTFKDSIKQFEAMTTNSDDDYFSGNDY